MFGPFFVDRYMPDVPEAGKQTDNKKYIETAFGILCNMPLLCNHSASWEILVSKRHIIDYNTDGNLVAHIPVISLWIINQKAQKFTPSIVCVRCDILGSISNSSFARRWCGFVAFVFGNNCRS